jgi:hypothetical protein
VSYRLGLGTLDDLARAIFRQEGSLRADGSWHTSSLGYRLNNPGNLVYAGQPGCHPQIAYDPGMGTNQTYAQCDSLDAGIQATQRQLALDASRGLTLQQRLSTWATGNQASYIQNVSGWLGVSPDTPLSVIAGQETALPAIQTADGQWTTPVVSGDDSSQPDAELSGISWGVLALAAGALLWMAWA